jgi:hypothetical protein
MFQWIYTFESSNAEDSQSAGHCYIQWIYGRLSHFHAIQSSRAGDRSKTQDASTSPPPKVELLLKSPGKNIFYTVHIYKYIHTLKSKKQKQIRSGLEIEKIKNQV